MPDFTQDLKRQNELVSMNGVNTEPLTFGWQSLCKKGCGKGRVQTNIRQLLKAIK